MSTNELVLSIGSAFRGAVDIVKNGLPKKEKQSTLALSILMHVERTPGISQGELGKILRRDPMTMSQAIRSLYNTGLIVSQPDEEDRRVKRLQPTKKGKGFGEGLSDAEQKLLTSLTKEWGKGRVSQFAKDVVEFNEFLSKMQNENL